MAIRTPRSARAYRVSSGSPALPMTALSVSSSCKQLGSSPVWFRTALTCCTISGSRTWRTATLTLLISSRSGCASRHAAACRHVVRRRQGVRRDRDGRGELDLHPAGGGEREPLRALVPVDQPVLAFVRRVLAAGRDLDDPLPDVVGQAEIGGGGRVEDVPPVTGPGKEPPVVLRVAERLGELGEAEVGGRLLQRLRRARPAVAVVGRNVAQRHVPVQGRALTDAFDRATGVAEVVRRRYGSRRYE